MTEGDGAGDCKEDGDDDEIKELWCNTDSNGDRNWVGNLGGNEAMRIL